MKRESLKQQAYSYIRDKIVSCKYAPGMMLNEEQLHQELTVSRTPIRDALSRLEQDGLIVIKPKKGILIAPLSLNEINHIYETRILIEPFALQEYGYTLDEQELLKSFTITKNLEENLSEQEMFKMDDDFHTMIIENIPNPYIKQCYQIISVQTQRCRIFTVEHKKERMISSNHEHLTILQYCLKHDWKAASEEMKKHLINSKNTTFELLMENPSLLSE